MNKIFQYVSLAVKLKASSLVRYFLYRIYVKTPFFSRRLVSLSQSTIGELFDVKKLIGRRKIDFQKSIVQQANSLIKGEFELYQFDKVHISSPPKWHEQDERQLDFFWKSNIGSNDNDIKDIWDQSRFQWAQVLALAHTMTGDSKYIQVLNAWFLDWIDKNPSYRGPNWACGQECAIRLINILYVVELHEPEGIRASAVSELVKVYCSRIKATATYAISQDNNHATSEAAGLYIGGAWLKSYGKSKADIRLGQSFMTRGQRILENRIDCLVLNDGGFSMYSTNYHRVLLNTLSTIEMWRRKFGLRPFSNGYYRKCKVATEWLYHVIDPFSGNAPNLGNNDGSNPFIIQIEDYQDFRPTVQLANFLFTNYIDSRDWPVAFDNLKVFGLSMPNRTNIRYFRGSKLFRDSGLAVLVSKRNKSTRVFVKYPNFEYRPSQNDIMHVDFWIKGENLLRDAGTYRYKCEQPWQSYFQSVSAHNTIQFDSREQMPRLGQFLLGAWPKASIVKIDNGSAGNEQRFKGAYRDYRGARHLRQVELLRNCLRVVDEIHGFSSTAVIRYRLSPFRNWSLSNTTVTDGEHSLTFSSDTFIRDIRIVNGWESRYYSRKTRVPVVEVTLTEHGSLTMEYQWA